MAVIITTDAAIQSVPANTPVITAIGDAVFSDKFNRAGALLGSAADLFSGGTAQSWAGTGQAANVTDTTNGGRANLGSTTGTFSTCVNAGRTDFDLSLRITEALTTTNGNNSMIEFNKAAADTGDTYRIGLGTGGSTTMANMALYKRVGGSAGLLINLPVYTIGTTIKINKKGARIRIYFNDVLVGDYTDTAPLTGTFCGFAGSSSNRMWRVTDFVIRSN